MNEISASQPILPGREARWGKHGVLVALVILLATALLGYRAWGLRWASAGDITQSELEARYGIRVQLIALTAGSGLVDMRLKVLDAEKAKILLQDQAQAPELMVGGKSIVLKAVEDSRAAEPKLENGSLIYNLYPNTRNAIQRGSRVTVVFGDIRLEPVVVK